MKMELSPQGQMGTGIHGGFGPTRGVQDDIIIHGIPDMIQGDVIEIQLPSNDAQIRHIFSDREGHLSDTPENRKKLLDLANSPSKYIGKGGEKMTQFELFCMIFYVLDADWDDTCDHIVSEYLSGANPFLFSDIGSADPSVYKHFCEVINDEITIANSYSLACKYIGDLNTDNLTKAFYSISKKDWDESVSDYLSQEHKGSQKSV